MKRYHSIVQSIFLLLLFSNPFAAFADYRINMPIGVTPLSKEVYDLHMLIFWVVVVIGILVFGVMFYAIIMHRKARGYQAAQFHEHTLVEVLWAIVPLLILVVMAIPASLVLIRMQNTGDAEINIKVTGYQWKWKYEYLDEGISFFSNLSTPLDQINNKTQKGEWYLLNVDRPLVVPVNQKIRFMVTSNDVVHSWWVPDFGIKQDAIPGYVREIWATVKKPGIYRGQCAELCGQHHAYMPIVVIAMETADYQNWLKIQKSNKGAAAAASTAPPATMTKDQLMQQGQIVYSSTCVACHQANGEGIPGVFKPIKGSPIAKGPVDKHIEIVLNGVKGTAMQGFGSQLSDADIAAVVTYERNAFGNNMNDLVQPSDVSKLHNQGSN